MYLGSVWRVSAGGWSNSSRLWLWSSPACPPTSWKMPSPRQPESEEENTQMDQTGALLQPARTSTTPFALASFVVAPFGWNPSAEKHAHYTLAKQAFYQPPWEFESWVANSPSFSPFSNANTRTSLFLISLVTVKTGNSSSTWLIRLCHIRATHTSVLISVFKSS